MTTEKEKVYIEDRLQRFAHWLGQILDGKYTEEDQEWDAFIDRLVAVRTGMAPASQDSHKIAKDEPQTERENNEID